MSDPSASHEFHHRDAPLLVLLNRASGNGQGEELAEHITELFRKLGGDADVHALDGEQIVARVEQGFGEHARCVVAAGGDGTVRIVATALVGTQHTLALLPLGTMNLFARSLAVPLELEAAVEVALRGKDARVDLCSVNGQAVLTNTSAGLYAEITAARERRRKQHQHWPRFVRWIYDSIASFWRMGKRWWRSGLTLSVDGERHPLPTRLFSVSNNEYAGWAQPKRRHDGKLSVLIPEPLSRLRTFWTAIKVALFGPRDVSEVNVRLANEVDVLGRGKIKAVLDGEVQTLSLPLEIRPLHDALTVRIPNAPPEDAD